MPSPFPGMDPYLEDPGLWPDVHHGLISQMQAELNEQLRPKYRARVEERVYVFDQDDPAASIIIPDLKIHERSSRGKKSASRKSMALTVAEPLIANTLLEDEIHETFLKVVDRETKRVVAVIEVLSPSNKVRGSEARESYRQKRKEVVNSPAHWVEIDLLRQGTPFLPRVLRGRGDYFVHVSRAELRPKGMLWPILLPQRLPVVSIPLRPSDSPAALDLQHVLTVAYERGAYDQVVDYRRPPPVPLKPQYSRWVDQLLRKKGVR